MHTLMKNPFSAIEKGFVMMECKLSMLDARRRTVKYAAP